MHIVSLFPALLADRFVTWWAPHGRLCNIFHLLSFSTCPLPVALIAVWSSPAQIDMLLGEVNCLGASAVMLYEMGDGTLLALVIKTCGKRMQAKKHLLQWLCLPHPVWFGTIQVIRRGCTSQRHWHFAQSKSICLSKQWQRAGHFGSPETLRTSHGTDDKLLHSKIHHRGA